MGTVTAYLGLNAVYWKVGKVGSGEVMIFLECMAWHGTKMIERIS